MSGCCGGPQQEKEEPYTFRCGGVVDGPKTQFKICIVGESGVGKSTLLAWIMNETFVPVEETTIGAAFASKTVNVTEEKKITLQFWDTAGQEKFRSLAPMYYRGADLILVVFDVTSRLSFTELEKFWEKDILEGRRDDLDAFNFIVVGTKTDLFEHRSVSEEEARKWCSSHFQSPPYFETSSKQGTGMYDFLDGIVWEVAGQQRVPAHKGQTIKPAQRKGK